MGVTTSLAVDYRYVNKFTVDDAYLLPDIQGIYQSVSKSTMISVTDCKQSYFLSYRIVSSATQRMTELHCSAAPQHQMPQTIVRIIAV